VAPARAVEACDDRALRPYCRRPRNPWPWRYRSAGALSPRSACALPRADAGITSDERHAPAGARARRDGGGRPLAGGPAAGRRWAPGL